MSEYCPRCRTRMKLAHSHVIEGSGTEDLFVCESCKARCRVERMFYFDADLPQSSVPTRAELELTRELFDACVAYHDAVDRLFAMLIERSPVNDTFYPSKCGAPWEALQKGNALIKRARERLAAIKESDAQ